MKNFMALWAFMLVMSFTANSQQVEFEEYDLENGLHVILHQDNSAPVITVGVMHDVGGKDLGGDNNPERTGFAHFFEHLLASGPTENIEKGTWRKIRAANGGSGNANTSLDRTYYYQSFPSDKLELALWMESERLLHPIIDQDAVDTQNEVVKEEKRMRYDNSPYGQILFAITENLYHNHPYKYKNIGEMDDLDAASLEEFQAYFDKWYVPANSVMVVAGDIDTNKTKKLINDYFNEIKTGPKPIRNFPKVRPITETEKSTVYDPNIQIPAIIAAYNIPEQTARDNYVLSMISSYLSVGKSSVLYKKLVDDQKQALAVQAVNLSQVDGGIYALFALPLGDNSLADVLNEIDEEILKLQNELISERDYQKLQNQFENQFVNSNSSVEGIANSLVDYYLLYGSANLINTEIDIYRSITREEIREVTKKYLNSNQRVEIEYLPKKNDQ
ncbi:MAG: peptidase M16 [Bacteroidetes bacterium MedPE-SWsnd-G1]|nr:MAG: peptidase M16 [Bacteroidetes bacterium MedPE-SWsnd-G1]